MPASMITTLALHLHCYDYGRTTVLVFVLLIIIVNAWLHSACDGNENFQNLILL